MLAAAFLSCVRSSGSCITSSRKPITRIFSSVFSSKSWGPTQEQQRSHYRSVAFLLQKHRKKERKKETKEKEVNCTCECLETQWRSTFRTLFVAALLITNSLSPFLWSVGKPETRFNNIRVKLNFFTNCIVVLSFMFFLLHTEDAVYFTAVYIHLVNLSICYFIQENRCLNDDIQWTGLHICN